MRVSGAPNLWRLSVASAAALAAVFFEPAFAAEPGQHSAMQLTSSAFKSGEPIPAKYTCDAKDVSPPLEWSGAPAQAKSLVLLVNDPDAPVGDWVHWVLYDLPASEHSLPEDLAKGQYVLNGARQGLNDFRHLGYGGPCPPPGKPHRYFFRIYALDRLLDLKPGLTRKEIEAAMQGHVLAEGLLIGTYQRRG
jgi:Raf kinase inhibitor-like YbhB/YbcL family protein